MIRALRRRWNWWRIARDARRALLTHYNHAEDRERRAAIGLGILAGVLLAFVIGLIVAGCGGRYPLMPGPDAADVTPDAALPACPAVVDNSDDCTGPPGGPFVCLRCSDGNQRDLFACVGVDTSGIGVTCAEPAP